MTISKLLCALPSNTFRTLHLRNPDTEITEILMLLPYQQNFQENCLYIGIGSLPSLPDDGPCNIMLWSWDGPIPPQGNIAVLSDPAAGPALFNQLQESLFKRQKMTAMFNTLISGPLTGEELQNLVDQAAVLLGNPIFLIGTDHRFLAASPMLKADDESIYSIRTKADLAAGIVGDEGVMLMERNGIPRRAADSTEPFIYYNAYLERTGVMTAIRVGGIEAATIAMIEVHRPFSADDLDCFGELAGVVAREMQKNEYFLQNADRKAGYFLGQLLDDPQPTPTKVTRQLSRLHFSPKARFFMAVFQFPSDPAPGVRYDILETQLRGVLYNTMQVTYQRRFVILFTRGEDEGLGDYVLNALRTQAEANHLAVGISNAFHSLTEVRRYYQQSLEAIRFGLRVPKENAYRPLFFYQDYAFIAMLEIPFTYALSHVLVEGVFNDKNEFVDMTVHMWEDCEGGCYHITAAVASTTVSEPPHFAKEILAKDPHAKLVPPSATDHTEYEASMWPKFLPQLYHLWEGHPDPSQNVLCDLTVRKTGENTWQYTAQNVPVTVSK